MATLPDVRDVAGMVMGFVSTPDVPLLIVFGLAPSTFVIDQFALVEGPPAERAGETMMGRPAANANHKAIGDVVRISGRPFRIVGLYETGVGYQDTGVVIDLREAQDIFEKPRQVSFYGSGCAGRRRRRA
ncbi:MAG: ABC transporter permease [Anaerolineae bacterium]